MLDQAEKKNRETVQNLIVDKVVLEDRKSLLIVIHEMIGSGVRQPRNLLSGAEAEEIETRELQWVFF